MGKGLITYTVPQGASTIEITCMYNGKEVAKRIAPVKNKTLYEVYLSDDFLYSTNPIIYKSR